MSAKAAIGGDVRLVALGPDMEASYLASFKAANDSLCKWLTPCIQALLSLQQLRQQLLDDFQKEELEAGSKEID